MSIQYTFLLKYKASKYVKLDLPHTAAF